MPWRQKKNVTPILHEATLMQPVDLDDSRFQLHGVVDSKRSSTGSPNSCRSMGWVQNLSNFLRYLSAPGAQTQEAQNQQANISSFFVDGMAVWVASVRVTEYWHSLATCGHNKVHVFPWYIWNHVVSIQFTFTELLQKSWEHFLIFFVDQYDQSHFSTLCWWEIPEKNHFPGPQEHNPSHLDMFSEVAWKICGTTKNSTEKGIDQVSKWVSMTCGREALWCIQDKNC